MNHQGKFAFVLIAIATLLIGFSVTPSNAVQTQAVLASQPIFEMQNAMIQTVDVDRKKQVECLARNMYFEARGEPTAGQLAVGIVTINRVKARHYPDTICGVVNQPYQFSWTIGNKNGRIHQPEVYAEIKVLANLLYDSYYANENFPDLVDGATHFHTNAVDPNWRGKRLVVSIGNHKFFTVGG
jgi:spore germination cell wall hydrolase CwlJ-like protein